MTREELKKDFKYYRHYTYGDLLLILFASNTREDLQIFAEYVNENKKSLPIYHLRQLNNFFKEKSLHVIK